MRLPLRDALVHSYPNRPIPTAQGNKQPNAPRPPQLRGRIRSPRSPPRRHDTKLHTHSIWREGHRGRCVTTRTVRAHTGAGEASLTGSPSLLETGFGGLGTLRRRGRTSHGNCPSFLLAPSLILTRVTLVAHRLASALLPGAPCEWCHGFPVATRISRSPWRGGGRGRP
jgi:hypothetical protein